MRWEYISLLVNSELTGPTLIMGYDLEGDERTEQPVPDNKSLAQVLNEMGLEGWELASVLPHFTKMGVYTFLFKRVVVEEGE